jgi:hypothetical protein
MATSFDISRPSELIFLTNNCQFLAVHRMILAGVAYSVKPVRAGRSEDPIQVAAKFSAPVQTGPGAHPAPTKCVPGLFPGAKRVECGADRPPKSSAEVKERVEI